VVDQMVAPRGLGASQGFCGDRDRASHYLAAGPVFVPAPVRAPARHRSHPDGPRGGSARQGAAPGRRSRARGAALGVSAPRWFSWALLIVIAVTAAAAVIGAAASGVMW
jgi:hypothetical protein